MGNEKLIKCVFCQDTSGKVITFVEDKLKKCKEVLQIRVNFKLKYNSVQLPEQINDTDGYHRNCYSSFTALMAKYRNLSEINFSSTVDLPTTSSSASTSNTGVSVQTTLSDETSQNSHTEVNIQDIDTSNTTIQPDGEVNIERNSNVSRVCFFFVEKIASNQKVNNKAYTPQMMQKYIIK